MHQDGATTQRWVVLVALAVVPLVRARTFTDAFSLPKAIAIVAVAVAVAATGAPAAAAWVRRRQRPTAFGGTVAVWLVGVVLSALLADGVVMALLGPYRRWNGALLYVAVGTLAVVVAGRFRTADVESVLRILGITAGVVVVHALAQQVELVDRAMQTTGSRMVATLGNANFVAAYLAISLPAVARQALLVRSAAARAAWGTVGLATVVAIVLTGSLQGIAAGAAALAVAAVVWTWQRRPVVARALLAAGAVGSVAGVVGLLGSGPLAFLAAERTFQLRTYYWAAAVDMFTANPVLGVGTGRYIDHFRAFRSVEAARELAPSLDVDGAHNVILDAFATGGLVVGGALVAALAVALVLLVRATARGGPNQGLLAAVGGAWMGWVTQALVSLDTPALLLLGWVLTGATVVVARASLAAVDPATGSATGAGAATPGRARKAQRAAQRRAASVPAWRRDLPGVPSRRGAVSGGAAALVVILAATPIAAAERAATRARAAVNSGVGAVAISEARSAVDAFGLIPTHHNLLAAILARTGDGEGAIDAYLQASARDTRQVQPLIGIAQAAGLLDDLDTAVDAYARALALDPHQASFAISAGELALEAGQRRDALDWAFAATVADPRSGDAQALLGRVHHELGDTQQALRALQRASELGTDDEVALALLDQLT